MQMRIFYLSYMYRRVKYCIAISLLLTTVCPAQKTETYYDFYWKPCEPAAARFYGTTEKTDSGWLRKDYYLNSSKATLQMQALYEDADCKVQHGFAVYYYANGKVSAEGRRVHGKREGVCVSYYSNGMMSDSAYWHNDVPLASRFRWYPDGSMGDSITRINDSTTVQISWWEDGTPKAAGYLRNDNLHGKWKFFHRNSQLAAEEVYDNGKVISKNYFNEDGTAQPDTAKANREASFAKGGMDGWRRYLENKIHWPERYKLVNTSMVTVGISFCVNEEGKITEVETWVPFDPVFDNEAMDIIKKSPPWQPALWHNIKIKAYRRQPLTFQQEE